VIRRGAEALGVARAHVAVHHGCLLLTAADSDISGLEVLSPPPRDAAHARPDAPLAPATSAGASLDGRDGRGTPRLDGLRLRARANA
jgi:alkaline phosphatase